MQTSPIQGPYVPVEKVLTLISEVVQLSIKVSMSGKANAFASFSGHTKMFNFELDGASSVYREGAFSKVEIFPSYYFFVETCNDLHFARLCEFYSLLESYFDDGQLKLELVS